MKQRWNSLIFGKYNAKQVNIAVYRDDWQAWRIEMLGKSLEEKYKMLKRWLAGERNYFEQELAKIQVTNYVYALKRGGLIK